MIICLLQFMSIKTNLEFYNINFIIYQNILPTPFYLFFMYSVYNKFYFMLTNFTN